jgi:hypothetical protein
MRLDFCCACGATEVLEQHHLKPKVLGGSDDETNLITLCPTCHDIAHDFKRASNRRELQKIGIAKAKERGVYKGRAFCNPELIPVAKELRESGLSVIAIGKQLGKPRATIYRWLAQ